MELLPTPISGCWQMLPTVFNDFRGSFVKTFHHDSFVQLGLETDWREEYYSVSHKGVLRGMHFQLPPHDHAKIVYCTAGIVLDAVVDLRRDSPTYGHFSLLELSAEKANMLYIPKGLAHGFYTVSESATMLYKVSSIYAVSHDTGILWNSLGIPWPASDPTVSARDSQFPVFSAFDTNSFPYR